MNELDRFSRSYAVWDPMTVWDGQRWFLYVLSTSRKVGVDRRGFWKIPCGIHGFVSDDLKSWTHLGEVIARGSHACLAAGSVRFTDGVFYFYYSASTDVVGGLVDQRVFLACSVDGCNFLPVDDFVVEPDEIYYPTGVRDSRTGQPLFAWRDPYLFLDSVDSRFYLFISAGGFNWRAPALLACAVADHPQGPFRLLGPVCDSRRQLYPIREWERIQIRRFGDRYWLLSGGWAENTAEECRFSSALHGERVTDWTTYAFSGNHILGPYHSDWERPIVRRSSVLGTYASQFVEPPTEAGVAPFAVGWTLPEFTIRWWYGTALAYDGDGLAVQR